MQAHFKVLSVLLLLLFAAPGGAQVPAVPGTQGQPGISAAQDGTNPPTTVIRRRFRARTNDINAATPPLGGEPAAVAEQNANPAAEMLPATNAPAAQQIPAFPQFPAVPPIRQRPVSTNQPVPQNTETAGQIPQVPTPGARTFTPIPGDSAAAEAIAADTDIGIGAAGNSSPVNPALSPDEIIPGGTISLQGMPPEQFFDLYSLYSGRTILRPYTLPAPQGLTLKAQTDLTRLEVVQAMDGVLALNNITMIPVGDKFVKAVPSNLADKEGMEISDAPLDELPVAEQFMTRIVKLKTAKPTEIAPTLQGLAKTPTAVTPIDSNQTLILRDYSSNIRRMLEIIEQIDVVPESDFTLEVIPIKYGKVMDIYSTMNALISGGGAGGASVGGVTGGTAGGSTFGRTGGFGSSMNRFGGSMNNRMGGGYNSFGGNSGYRGGYGGGMGGGYYPQELDQEVFPQQAAPGAAQGSFQQRLNQIVNRAANPDEVQILENAQIVPDERSNKLLIFANKRDMVMITNIVSKVDVLLAQVLIEAIIMEVKLDDSLAVGISAAQHPRRWGQDFSGAGAMNNGQLFGALTNFPSGTPDGFSYFGTIGNDFDVAIRALADDNEIKILSRPRIQTSHAIPGSFFIGETVPYITGTTDYGLIGSGLSTRSTITEREIGLTLDVVPFITPEGMVVMEIMQNFQQRGLDVIIDGNPIPLVNTRAASAVLTVRDGDLIMLGGFITETASKSKSGVPFLKDIPGLGVLFRSSNKSNDRTELIILMKATVLETPEAAAFLAERERLQLPGVRKAEREFEESETKRLKKIERKGR